MFKKKKKEFPPLPEPKIIKQWKNYRLVQIWYHGYEDAPEDHLILEFKHANAMNEIFWKKEVEEGDKGNSTMFGLFRETFLNE